MASSLTAFGAVKAGSPCTKVGSTSTIAGMKYTCVKTGKKLVWNKGIAFLKPTPSPTPTSSKASAPISESESAFKSIVKYYNESQPASYDLIKVIHPSVTQKSAQNIVNRYNRAVQFWRDNFAIKKVYLIVGNNDEIKWVKDQLELATPYKNDDWYKNFSKNMPEQRCKTYSAGSYGINPNGYFMQSFNLYAPGCQTEEPQDPNYRTTVEHELTHAAQSAATGNKVEYLPCWFKEGQASYYGSAIGNLSSFAEFQSSLNFQRRYLRGIDPKSQLRLLDEKYNNFSCGQDGGYALGSLAVEQLVIKYSHLKVLDFVSDVGRTGNWTTSFKSVFGQTFDEFLARLSDQDLAVNL